MNMRRKTLALLMLTSLLTTMLFPAFAQEGENRMNTRQSAQLLSRPVELAIYARRLDPSTYPEDQRRTHQALTWDAFDGVTQFVAGRNLPKSDVDLADVAGRVYRPNLASVNDAFLKRALQYASARKLIVHNIGGFGPGSRFSGSFGEYIVPESKLALFEKYVADTFTGFDVGEQDGRFNFTYAQVLDPYVKDRVAQYLASQPYFDRVAADQGNWCSSLSVLWYWHYLLKEGYVVLAGAETQNKITNGQVQYAFIRGAGKQYGVLPYGDISVFDSWGYKNYGTSGGDYGVNNGGSLSLIRRSFYTQYMYGSTILSMEQGWCEGPWATNKGTLSPLGIMQNDCAAFVESNGSAGDMLTPVGMLMDFYSGWMPARHIAGQFRVWNGMDYEAGDYLTDSIVSMFYPNYEESGFYHDESGAMTAAPYGEIMDGLLSDARLETLKQYSLIVAAGDLFSMTEELSDKLHAYVQEGGTLFITAENASRLFPEWQIGDAVRMPAGTDITMCNTGDVVTEACSFDLHTIGVMPPHAEVIMNVGEAPAMLDIPLGEGRVLLSLTPYGLNAEAKKYNNPGGWFGPGIDKDLGRPYELLTHVQALLDEVLTGMMPFSAGDDLGLVTTRVEDKHYRVCVYNTLRENRPFEITTTMGTIDRVEELSTGTALFDAPGWWPNGLAATGENLNDDTHIRGGDVRIFDVYLRDESVAQLPEQHQPAAVENVLLCADTLLDVKENIRRFPTFFDHFSGVAVPAQVLLNASDAALIELNAWFDLQKLEIAANLNGQSLTEDEMTALSGKLALLHGEGRIVDVNDAGWHEEAGARVLQAGSFDANEVYLAIGGKSVASISDCTQAQVCDPENSMHILSMEQSARDILDFVADCDGFYDIFGGVAVPGTYLYGRTDEALMAEAEALKAAGITVVLDLTEEINHYPGRTLIDAVPEYYERDMIFYRECLRKLAILGGDTAIFTTHTAPEAHYTKEQALSKMQETLAMLAEEAKNYGVKLLLANTRFRLASGIAEQRQMINAIGAENMGLCINLNHAQAGLKSMLRTAGDTLGAVILGGVDNGENAAYLPVARSTWQADVLNGLEGVLLIEKSRPYSWEQTLEDVSFMQWK